MRTSLTLSTLLLCGGCCLPMPFGQQDDAPPPPPIGASPVSPVAAPAPPAPPAPTPPPPEANPTELAARKIALYSTECINTFSERALSSRARYLSWVDAERGPTGRERHIYGLYRVSGQSATCREAVTRAATMAPSMPEAEQAAEQYVTALVALLPLLYSAERYYDRETYRDDDMAGGQEMHPRLMAAFDAFASADAALRAHVEAVQDAARAERIERMATDPAQRGNYLVERTLSQALSVVRMADQLRVESNRYVSDDPEALIAAVQQLQTGVDELTAHSSSDGPRGFGEFRGQSEEVLESALSLMRRVRDGVPFRSAERSMIGRSSSWMVDGSFGQLQRRYNELVRAYNGLRR